MAESGSVAPSDAFLESVASIISSEDLQGILEAQVHMLGRYEKTNEMLSNFNSLSCQRYEKVSQQFREHTQLLLDMKMDLDSIFRRIRSLKLKLARDYPKAFEAAVNDITPPDLGDDDEEKTRVLPEGKTRVPPEGQPKTTLLSSEKEPKISTFETVQQQTVQLKSVQPSKDKRAINDTKKNKPQKQDSSEYTEERLLQEVLSFDGRIRQPKPHDKDSQD